MDLLVQTLLFYACCFTDRTGYYKSKLTKFTEDPGCHRLSLCMSLAYRTAAKLGPCCQPCFAVTNLLLLPTPQMRYKRFLRQRSRTQKGVLVDLLCLQGPPLKHRFAHRISVRARTCSLVRSILIGPAVGYCKSQFQTFPDAVPVCRGVMLSACFLHISQTFGLSYTKPGTSNWHRSGDHHS